MLHIPDSDIGIVFSKECIVKRIVAIFSAVALVPAMLVGVPSTAHAVLDQVCTVSAVVTYNPPLTDTPQATTIIIAGNLFNCTSTANPTGTYATTDFAPSTSCTDLLSSNSGSRVLNWTNPAFPDSTFTFNRQSQRVNGTIQATFLGEIMAGVYTPSPAKQVMAAPEPDVTACSGSGVSTLTYIGSLEIGI